MRIQLFAAQTFWSLVNHVLSRGSTILAAILLARSLEIPSFAAFSYFQLTTAMLAGYASLGFGVTSSLVFASSAHDAGEREAPIGMLLLLSGALATLALGVVFLVPRHALTADLDIPRWAMGAGVFVSTVAATSTGAVLGLAKFRDAALVSACSGSLMLGGAWLAAARGSATWAMGVAVTAAAVQVLGESALVFRTMGRARLARSLRIDRTAFDHIMSLGGPMVLVTICSVSGPWLLSSLILHAKGEGALALYSIGLQWFSFALLLPGMASRVILPELVKRAQSHGTLESQQIARLGAFTATAAAVLIVAVFPLLGPTVLSVYGPRYAGNHWLIVAFMAAAIFIAPANILGNVLIANSEQRTWLGVTIVWLATLIAVGWCTRSLGAWAGPASQIAAGIVMLALGARAVRSRRLI